MRTATFDLQKALTTHKVETIGGKTPEGKKIHPEPVINFSFNPSCKEYPYRGFINGALYTWTAEGLFFNDGRTSENDLQLSTHQF